MSQSSSGRVREGDIWKRGRGQTEGKEKHMGQKGDKVIKEELRHIRRGGGRWMGAKHGRLEETGQC